jgi:hypothetical protein
MKKTYKGSCHCGAVRYEADVDLSEGTLKCNCSICTKTRAWLTAISPDSFRLLAGNTDLTEYQFNTKNIHHLFCKHCGVRSFGWGEDAIDGKFYAIHITCLDDIGIDELVNTPVTYVDGRHDNWRSPLAETRYL